MGGCNASQPISPTPDKSTEPEQTVEWKLLPSSIEARKKFELDGTLSKNSDPGHLEFRTMLDDPIAQPAIFKFARQVVMAQDIYMCWIDIQEYKNIPSESYRRSTALHIYHKYIKADAILVIGDIELAERERYKQELANSKDDPSILSINFYDKIQTRCFLGMYHNVYLPFKQTDEYLELTKQLQKRYNHVKLNDFEYFGKLGEGGFGFVVHCRKKSTGKHYAMKLQTKKGLIECFSDDPWRADFEKQAFASCQHPFIVNLDYAFQTDALAIMVLGLATAGDLQKALNKAPEEKLSEERVRFYVAEIVLALSYLHQMGLMYRDLKPNNILLNDDGHIQLVDLGGVADEYGLTLGQNDGNNLIPLFAQHFSRSKQGNQNNANPAQAGGQHGHLGAIEEENKESGATSPYVANQTPGGGGRMKPKRKLSIMGTFGYMAPEMVIMLSQASHEKTGYTYAVDWWSLGVTMFKLLTGYRPFTDDNFNTFVEMATTMNALVREHCDSPEYAILFQEIPFPTHISPEAKDLISKLLDVNPKTRLGSGVNGSKNIKSHIFFKGIDWDLLEQKHIEPPYRPDHSRLLDELIPYPDFETLMKEYNKADWTADNPPKEAQRYFANWNFTSPQTIRIESGIAHVMEQYDRSFKVQQLMGADAKHFNPADPKKNQSNNPKLNKAVSFKTKG